MRGLEQERHESEVDSPIHFWNSNLLAYLAARLNVWFWGSKMMTVIVNYASEPAKRRLEASEVDRQWYWHPSVSKGYGIALWLVVLEERLVWSVAGLSPWLRAFLVCLFVWAHSESVSSGSEGRTARFLSDRSEVKVSHLLMSMSTAFRSFLQTSL